MLSFECIFLFASTGLVTRSTIKDNVFVRCGGDIVSQQSLLKGIASLQSLLKGTLRKSK